MTEKTIKIGNDVLFKNIAELIDKGHEATIVVVGHSMEPFFESYRDEIKLSKCNRAKINDMILAYTTDKRYVAHRVIAVNGNIITMRGDGNVYGVEHTTQQDIVGIITAYRRRGRKKFHAMYTWKWKAYSFLWMHLGPMRRWALAIHHHIYLKLIWALFKPKWMEQDKKQAI